MNKYDISDTLIERPVTFTYKRGRYSIYPLSLGKIQLCSRLIEALGFNQITKDKELYTLAIKTASEAKERCVRLISYVTLPGGDCLDETKVSRRIREFKGIKSKDLASLLLLFLTMDKTDEIMREFAIDKEARRLSDVMKVKAESKDNGSLSFGGKSIWGALVDAACERYGWTYQYVIWGISFSALRLLLADHVKTVFLSDEERKRMPAISRDGITVDASDTAALNELIQTQSWR